MLGVCSTVQSADRLSFATCAQAKELVKARMKHEFGPEILDMLNALSDCTRKISEDSLHELHNTG